MQYLVLNAEISAIEEGLERSEKLKRNVIHLGLGLLRCFL